MNKLVLLSVFFLLSCVRPQYFAIRVPHDYDGYIFLVLNTQTKNSEKLEQKGVYVYVTLNSPPVQFLAGDLNDEIKGMRLLLIDRDTNLLINKESEDGLGKKVFENGIKKLSINNRTYQYVSVFVTKDLYKSGSKILDSIKTSKQFQLDFLNKKLDSLSRGLLE